MSVRLQRARYIRYCFVGVLILLDLFALPWAVVFSAGGETARHCPCAGDLAAQPVPVRRERTCEVRMNTKYIVQLPMVNTPAMGM